MASASTPRPPRAGWLLLIALALLLAGVQPASASSAWKVTDLKLDEAVIYGVSCTKGLCVGAGTGATPPEGLGSAGVIVSSQHPLAGAAAWKVTLFPRSHLTPQLRDVSCPSTHLCVAVANKGTVLTSSEPMGGRSAWRTVRLPAGSLRHVSCPSPRFCLIAGNRGKFFASTDPAGGAASWRSIPLAEGFAPSGVSCSSKSLCAAVGGFSIFGSGEPLQPTSWQTTSDFDIDAPPSKGVDCPSRYLCLVGGLAGVYVSREPAEAESWARTPLASAETATTAVECVSPEACLVATEIGYVFSSDSPASPDPTWRRSRLPLAFDSSPFALSCSSLSLCVATGHNGLIATSASAFGPTARHLSYSPAREPSSRRW